MFNIYVCVCEYARLFVNPPSRRTNIKFYYLWMASSAISCGIYDTTEIPIVSAAVATATAAPVPAVLQCPSSPVPLPCSGHSSSLGTSVPRIQRCKASHERALINLKRINSGFNQTCKSCHSVPKSTRNRSECTERNENHIYLSIIPYT